MLVELFTKYPQKTFSTTDIVQHIFPAESHERAQSIALLRREPNPLAVQNQRLHRRALHHLSQLERNSLIEVVAHGARGQKYFRKTPPATPCSTQTSTTVTASRRLHFVQTEIDTGMVFSLNENSPSARIDALYIDCARLTSIEELAELVEQAVRYIRDVLCLSSLHALCAGMSSVEVEQSIRTLRALACDAGCSLCVVASLHEALSANMPQFVASAVALDVPVVMRCEPSSLFSETWQAICGACQRYSAKIQVHCTASRVPPLFVGRAGVYRFDEELWRQYCASTLICCAYASETLIVDLGRLRSLRSQEVRSVVFRAVQALHASLQRTQCTEGQPLFLRTRQNRYSVFVPYVGMLRLWNYEWDNHSSLFASIEEQLAELAASQRYISVACGLASTARVLLSSTFATAHAKLSARMYRTYTVESYADLQTPLFEAYAQQRLEFVRLCGGADRFRIFRAGQPNPSQLAREVARLTALGFSFVVVECSSRRGVRQLTEYFS